MLSRLESTFLEIILHWLKWSQFTKLLKFTVITVDTIVRWLHIVYVVLLFLFIEKLLIKGFYSYFVLFDI